MHQLVPLKFKISIVVVLAMIASYAASRVTHHPLSISASIGVVEAIVVWGLLKSWRLFSYLPKWAKLGWMRVDLNGQWQGKIHSQYKVNPNDALQPPIDVTLEIKQGWRDVVLVMETAQMDSRTNTVNVFYDEPLEELQLVYTYKTTPKASAPLSNPAQVRGMGVARIKLSQPDVIKITYTNERGRGGEIEFKRV